MLVCMFVSLVLWLVGIEGILGFFDYFFKFGFNEWFCFKRMVENERERLYDVFFWFL